MKKFTLVDADISTVKEHDGANNSANRLKQLSKAGTVVLALALGSTTLTGCFSDPVKIQGQATLLEAEGAVLTLIDLPLTGKGFPN